MSTNLLSLVGEKVVTLDVKNKSKDWNKDVISDRKFGKIGLVIKHSDSHGLCYLVKYDDDGAYGWFDYWELLKID